jgi:hypothetical protein
MSFKQFLNEKLLLEYPLSLLGSGNDVDISDDEIKLDNSLRNKYSKLINEDYYSSLSELTDVIITALKSIGLTPIVGQGEEWVGTMSGAMSDGDSVRLKVDLVKDGKKIKNSQCIINIQKDNGRSKIYELNTYLS